MAIFTNQAQITYNGRTVLSNVAQGEIPELYTITKRALGDTYSPYGSKTYVVTITNASRTALSGVTVNDNLGEYTVGGEAYYPLDFTGPMLVFVNGGEGVNIEPTVTAPTLEYTIPTVPAGGSVVIVYETAINGFAPLASGSTVDNTVVASGGGLFAPISDTETVSIGEGAILSLNKSVTPTTVSDGMLTYTITVLNSGNVAADGVVLTDTFDPILSDITVTLDGEPFTFPDGYTYDSTSGLFTIPEGVITVPAATYTTLEDGQIETVPGEVVITISGRI